ncbi:uncharacterized protein [Maniola hyperantus]|uniref:uncharacterized protein n=1 Tax=Aphantopus hyperantus TaxID=2795564 RepID=UPI002139AB24
MDFKGICSFFIMAAICLEYTNALPRDGSVVKFETVSKNPDLTKMKVIPTETSSQFGIPGRVTCPYEEATEDSSCQPHCILKGYSYGLCVRGTCSCI